MALTSGSQFNPIKFHISDSGLKSIESEDGGGTKINKNMNLKRMAIAGVYKIMDYKNIQQHVVLQKYCIQALGSNNNPTTSQRHKSVLNEDIGVVLNKGGDVAPIVELMLRNIDIEQVLPPGFEMIERTPAGHDAFFLSMKGVRYQLCFKRQTNPEEVPIRDIQVIVGDATTPHGYVLLSPEYLNDEYSSSKNLLNIAYTKVGHTSYSQLTLISSLNGEKTPSTYTLLQFSPKGIPADIKGMLICFTKDLSFFIDSSHDCSDLKYVVPLVLALQSRDTQLGMAAIDVLTGLVNASFFCKKSTLANGVVVRHATFLRTLIPAITSAVTYFNRAFLDSLVELLLTVIRRHYCSLELEELLDVIRMSFLLNPQQGEILLQETIKIGIAYCMKEKQNCSDSIKEEGVNFASIINETVDNIVISSFLKKQFRYFCNLDFLSPKFLPLLSHISQNVCIKNLDQKLSVIIMALSKMCEDENSHRAAWSVSMLDYTFRQLDAVLKMLAFPNIENHGSEIKDISISVLSDRILKIVRQFVGIPVIGWIGTTPAPVFEKSLAFLNTLSLFRVDLKFELGHAYSLLLQYLKSTLLPRKMMVIDFYSGLIDGQIWQLYSNYDNCETPFVLPLLFALTDIVKEIGGVDNESVFAHVSALKNHKNESIKEVSFDSQEVNRAPAQVQALKRACLALCLDICTSMSQYSDGKDDIMAHYMKLLAACSSSTPLDWSTIIGDTGTLITPAALHLLVQSEKKSIFELPSLLQTIAFEKVRANESILKQAVELSKTKSLSKAIDFCIASGIFRNRVEEIVQFLCSNLYRFEIEAVGDYLGGTRPKEEKPQEELIRVGFLRSINFDGLAIHDAMRVLLTSSGFRLPSEAQKIDRLLESFGAVYSSINPEYTPDSVYVLSNAILMLNTSLHNPLIKSKDRIGFTQFESMVSHIDGCILSKKIIQEIYYSVEKSQFKIDLPTAASFMALKKNGAIVPDLMIVFENNLVSRIRSFKASCTFNVKPSYWNFDVDSSSLQTLFVSTFQDLLAALLSTMDFHLKSEISIVGHCIDGVKSLLVTSVKLGCISERDAILDYLARFTFIAQSYALSKEDLHSALLTKNYLNSGWRSVIRGMLSKSHVGIEWVVQSQVEYLSKMTDRVRALYTRQINKWLLEKVQARCSDINVFGTDHMFISEGVLCKLCAESSIRAYTIIILNDVLIYASSNGAQLKVHRVIQLCYCQVVDADGFSFKLLNPQKSIVLIAKDADEKLNWIQMIQVAIDMSKALRSYLVSIAESQNAASEVIIRLRSTAAFIGKTVLSLKGGKFVLPNDWSTCLQCLKLYSLFNRKTECEHCLEPYCSSCVSQTVESSKSKRIKVCDCCYGILVGSVSSEVPSVLSSTVSK